MNKRNLCSSVFFIFFAVFVVINSIGLGIGLMNNPQPGFFPFTASLSLLIFCFALLAINFKNINSAIKPANLWKDLKWRKNIIIIIALILHSILLSVIGYIPATFALMIVLFTIEGMKTWPAIINSALAVFFSYGLFQYIFKIPLPRAMWSL